MTMDEMKERYRALQELIRKLEAERKALFITLQCSVYPLTEGSTKKMRS
jgi:hypothetical protein